MRSLLGSFDFLRLRVEDGFDVGHYIFEGGFAFQVEQVQNDDDGQLNRGKGTFRRKAITDRVNTNDDVPEDPLFWYSSELQVTPQ